MRLLRYVILLWTMLNPRISWISTVDDSIFHSIKIKINPHQLFRGHLIYSKWDWFADYYVHPRVYLVRTRRVATESSSVKKKKRKEFVQSPSSLTQILSQTNHIFYKQPADTTIPMIKLKLLSN